MMTTYTTLSSEIRLSPPYRQAQRLLAGWIQSRRTVPDDHSVFAVRAALGALGNVEYDRLTRWLAWLEVATVTQGEPALSKRLKRLDTALSSAVRMAAYKLPVEQATPARHLRLTA